MSELFTRVTDPRQARLCDFLVLPPAKRPILSPKTASSLGLPNGFTCRSPNSTITVKKLFSGEGTQMFFLSSAYYTTISETDRLLNPSAEDLVPEIRAGTLFPLGRVSKGIEFSVWMKACADLKNGILYPAAIEQAFLRAGYDRRMTLTDSVLGKLTDDLVASDVCDTFRSFGTPGANAADRIPHSDGASPTKMCLKSLDISPYGCLSSSYKMTFIRGSFLAELVKRGALLVRPSDAMLEAITNRYLHWYADCVHEAFGERISTVDLAMIRLRNAREADKTRKAKWARVKRLTAKLSSKRMEAFTQALEGMAAKAQKGKKR